MSKKNVKNEFKVLKIWPLSSKKTDDKTILINAYTTTPHTSYEENDNLEAFNDNQQGGIHGITKELMNLTPIVKLIESRNNVGKMWNLNTDTTWKCLWTL